MSTTLNFVDHLLQRARNLNTLGLERQACQALTRLTGLRQLPPAAAEETQQRLAEILLRRRKFTRARRHLAALLAYQPDNAHYHYLMASAVAGGSQADPDRALRHYRRCLELDPTHARSLTDSGLLALRLGQTEEGLANLRRAVEVAADDAEVMSKVVDGLRLARRFQEAKLLLRTALFRNSRQPRFRKLWDDFRFTEARRRQRARQRRLAAARYVAEGPVILPFVLPPEDTVLTAGSERIIRKDPPAPRPRPHLPRQLGVSDKRHA